MLDIKLNEKETISLDIKTILSCMFLCNSNDVINDNLDEDLTKIILNLPSDLLLIDDKTDIINHNVARLMILYGLKEKIEKELSIYSC